MPEYDEIAAGMEGGGVFEFIGGSKEAEATELRRRMNVEGHLPEGYVHDGQVKYTDVEGMDVPETRLFIPVTDLDDWCTAWFHFSDGSEGVWVRVDDDKFHALTDEEFGDE